MKRQQSSVENQEEKECSNEKRSREASDFTNENHHPLSEPKGIPGSFTVSAKALMENIHLKEELETVKSKHQKELKDLENITMNHLARADIIQGKEKQRADEAEIEVQKLEAELLKAADMLKESDQKISELESKLSEQSINADEKTAPNIKALQRKLQDAEKAETEGISREERLEKRIREYRRILKSKDDIIDDLKIRRKNYAKELEKFNFERNQLTSKNESLQRSVNELLEAEKRQKSEIADLQNRLNEITQELGKHKMEKDQEMFEDSIKAETFEREILDSQKLLKLKDHQIADLQKQLNEKQQNFEEKLKEDERIFGTKLTDLEAINAKSQVEISILENKCDMHQIRIEKLKLAADPGIVSMIKQMEEKDAELEKAKDENGKLKEKFEHLKQAAKGVTTAKMERSAKVRAKKLVKSRKSDEKANEKCSSCPEKDKLIQQLQNQLNQEKEMNESMLNGGDGGEGGSTSFEYGPKWLVPQEKCENIYHTNPSLKNFLQQYTTELFNRAEILLPEEKISSKKMEEAKAVIVHFFKPDNDVNKELYFGQLKSVLNDKRYPARYREYKKCNSTRSIGFTSDGLKFYYCLKSHNVWKPYKDVKEQNILAFRKTSLSSFGIPSEYAASSEYILIVQNSDSGDEPKIFKMSPTSGAIELLTKIKAEK